MGCADSESNGGFRFLCEMFGTSLDLDDADAVKNAENMVQQRLYKPWRNALHYGKDQDI